MANIRFLPFIKTLIIIFLFISACDDSEFDDLQTAEDISTFEFFDEPRRSVYAIHEDEEGNLWLGTDGNGALRFDGTQFTYFTTSEGMLSNIVYSIIEDETGVVWFGTENGLNILEDGQIFFFTALEGVAVSSLAQDEDGIVWIGTFDFGLLFLENGQLFQFIDDVCIACNVINTIFEDSKGMVWFGTGGGLRGLENDRLTLYTTTDGLSGNDITSIYEDQWGSYWIGTRDGAVITRFDGVDDFEEVSLLNGFSQNFITSTTEDRQGNLLIGTVGLGLVEYNGIVMSRVEEDELDDTIVSMITDQSGDVWIGTFDGTLVKYTGGRTL